MKGRLAILAGFLATLAVPLFFPQTVHAVEGQNTTSQILISEIKLGGDSFSHGADQPKDPQEFVTLFNQTSSTVQLDGWELEYAKPTFDNTFCSATSWTSHSVSGSASATLLSGSLEPGQVSLPIVRSLTDNTAGSLRLVNASDPANPVVEDLVGWGATSPCFENTVTTIPNNGKSLKRFLDCDSNFPIDTNNNSLDFATNQPPSPGSLSNPYITTCDEGTVIVNPNPSGQTCEGIIISEFLPNPAGTDSSHEFVELYNPTSTAISLVGCSLQTSANSHVYNFGNISLQPNEYRAFYDGETGLTLPNAAGGTVWLLSPTTELQAITYPGNLDDDQAWILLNGTWYASYQPTPNEANVYLELKPCTAGQERNPDTGYCHSSTANVSSSGLSPCNEGQERNPATNRCRSIFASSSSLIPCKAGQFRNPATNRCKSTASASAGLKPCMPGYERNPATNRCKKSTSTGQVAGISTVKDSPSGPILKNTHWLLAGFAVIGATSYGVYEWRQELVRFLGKLKFKLPGK